MRNRDFIFITFIFAFWFSACSGPEGVVKSSALPACKELSKFPVLFSDASDSLSSALNTKGITALTNAERTTLFKGLDVPSYVVDTAFRVFPLNCVTFASSKVIVYLVKAKFNLNRENDCLVLVVYNKAEHPTDVLWGVLMDVYTSTYEVNWLSKQEFEMISVDREYSPDPQSEAEDIKQGRVPEPAINMATYRIDTLRCKFIATDEG